MTHAPTVATCLPDLGSISRRAADDDIDFAKACVAADRKTEEKQKRKSAALAEYQM